MQAHVARFAQHYQFLATTAVGNEQTMWKMTVKIHYVCAHLPQQAELINPRFVHGVFIRIYGRRDRRSVWCIAKWPFPHRRPDHCFAQIQDWASPPVGVMRACCRRSVDRFLFAKNEQNVDRESSIYLQFSKAIFNLSSIFKAFKN